MVNLSGEAQDLIIRRGDEAEAFMHSSLFVDISDWAKQEESMLGAAIALDRRDDFQKALTREQFVEQMSGYYRGIKTVIGTVQGFVSKRNELQKVLLEEKKKAEAESIEEAKRKELKDAAGIK
jgi:hypothetical protein